jgi:hypothetical protein
MLGYQYKNNQLFKPLRRGQNMELEDQQREYLEELEESEEWHLMDDYRDLGLIPGDFY